MFPLRYSASVGRLPAGQLLCCSLAPAGGAALDQRPESVRRIQTAAERAAEEKPEQAAGAGEKLASAAAGRPGLLAF